MALSYLHSIEQDHLQPNVVSLSAALSACEAGLAPPDGCDERVGKGKVSVVEEFQNLFDMF